MSRLAPWLLVLPLAVGCAGGPDAASDGDAEAEPIRSDGPAPPSAAEAKAAMERGLQAVGEGEPAVAARHFFQAWTLDPTSTEAVFNVGLAKARAGRDLDALPWLEAYLALRPDAENAAAVRAETARLGARVEETVGRLVQAAIAAYDKLDPKERPSSFFRGLAKLGRIDEAVKLAPKGEADRAKAVLLHEEARLDRLRYGLWATGARDELLPMIRSAGDARVRGAALAAFAEQLVLEDKGEQARALLPELDEAGRDVYRAAVAWRYVRKKDLVAVEELLPSLSVADRRRILFALASAKVAEGDLAGAERLLDRVGEVDWPPALVEVVVELACAHARAGRPEEVKALAKKRLLPLAASAHELYQPPVRAVAAFLLGNVEAALAELPRVDLSGISFGRDRLGRHHLYAIGLLLAGLLGQDEQAATIRGAFERRVLTEYEADYLKVTAGWMDWAEAMTWIGRGAPARALPAFKRIRPKLQDEVIPEYVGACLAAGQLEAAESIVWSVPEEACDLTRHSEVDPYTGATVLDLAQARVEALLRIAEARAGTPDARRLLRAAVRILRRSNQTCVVEASLLERLAAAQDRAGDADGAAETRRLVVPRAATRRFARALLTAPIDPEARVKERLKDTKPGGVPEAILAAAASLLDDLWRVQPIR